MTQVPSDTSAEREAEYFALLRNAGPEGRARILRSLCSGVRRLAEAGVRSAHPEYTDAQVQAELAARMYGPDVARRLFPFLGGPPA